MRNFQFESRLPIDSVQKLLDDIQALRAEKSALGHTWYFRGDRTSDALKPSIGQELKYAGKKLIADDIVERKFLNRFKRYAYQQFNRIDNDWEAR